MRDATPGLEGLPDADLREAALSNWAQLNAVMRRASPALIFRLLELEVSADAPRLQILTRLHGRLARGRADHERRLLARIAASGGEVEDGEDLSQLFRALEPPV